MDSSLTFLSDVVIVVDFYILSTYLFQHYGVNKSGKVSIKYFCDCITASDITGRKRRSLHHLCTCTVYAYEQTCTLIQTLTSFPLRPRRESKVCFCNCAAIADCLTGKQRCGVTLPSARNSNELWLTSGQANRAFIVNSKVQIQPFFYPPSENKSRKEKLIVKTGSMPNTNLVSLIVV